jgi:hypothetical protein
MYVHCLVPTRNSGAVKYKAKLAPFSTTVPCIKTVHRQKVEVTNAESTKRRTTKRRKTKRRMGQNVEWKKRRMVQNVKWKKRRLGQKVE